MFKNKAEIKELVKRADNAQETIRLGIKFEKLKQTRSKYYLTLDELNEILLWKLRGQLNRQKTRRTINTDENVVLITRAAFAVKHADENVETTLKLKLLSSLAGVEIPVASAILALCYPDRYSVIDFRNWRHVFKTDTRKSTYTTNDYVKYLARVRVWAKQCSVTPQELDIAIWQHDIESRKK